MSDTQESLGQLLARLRKARGLKMPEVIEALKVPRSTAYWWEGARGRPPVEDLQRLLDLYRASPEDRLSAWTLRSASSEPPLDVGFDLEPTLTRS